METKQTSLSPSALIGLFLARKKWWVTTTIVGGVLGLTIAILMPRSWEAHQAIIVREMANGDANTRPGRFSRTTDMKTLQETILEIAKSKSVLKATLEEVGPPKSHLGNTKWLSARSIEKFRKKIALTPPGGAEFGKTEIAYLGLQASSQARALKMVEVLCNQLDKQFRELRNARAQSMIDELQNAERLAVASLQEATKKLKAFETETGTDLSELRMLSSSSAASSDLRQGLIASENNLKQFELKKREAEQLLTVLLAARDNPKEPLATPLTLVKHLPALARLNNGLVDAQLKKAQLLGIHSTAHPKVLAAAITEREIRSHLTQQLEIAIHGLDIDLKLHNVNVNAVTKNIKERKMRLGKLASQRADYADLLALSLNRTKIFAAASKTLSEARAAQASALAASLIQRIDAPEVGIYPVGPGRTVVAGAGWIGGFVFGVGLLLVFTDFSPSDKENQPMASVNQNRNTSVPRPVQSNTFAEAVPKPLPPKPKTVAPVPTEKKSPNAPRIPVESLNVSPELTATKVAQASVATQPAPVPKPSIKPVPTTEFGLKPGKTLRKALEQVAKQDRS